MSYGDHHAPPGQPEVLEIQSQPVPDSALEAMAQARDAAEETRRICCELHELVRATREPARLLTIALTQTTPYSTDSQRGRSLSIGILNPTDVKVYICLDGERPSGAGRSLSCPPESLLVLPVSATDVTIATDDDLSGGDAIVFLLRFASVQPAGFQAI
jgi:hypothetical protein